MNDHCQGNIPQYAAQDVEITRKVFKAMVQKPVRWRPRGFAEWRWSEIGIGFSLSFDRLEWTGMWIPNVWLHLGPLIIGLEAKFS